MIEVSNKGAAGRNEEFRALPEPDRQDLVGEAFHTFGEDAARSLAETLAVDFDGCREAIERLRHRPH